jgi:hypothetical protein
MNASHGRAEFLHWCKHARILRAAGMQNDSTGQFFPAYAGELARHSRNGIIRRGNQDDLRQKNMTRKAGMRLAGSDESNGAPGRRFACGNNNANLPTQFPQTAPKRTPNAASPHDGQSLFHLVLA